MLGISDFLPIDNLTLIYINLLINSLAPWSNQPYSSLFITSEMKTTRQGQDKLKGIPSTACYKTRDLFHYSSIGKLRKLTQMVPDHMNLTDVKKNYNAMKLGSLIFFP